jgi:hypothetical protein
MKFELTADGTVYGTFDLEGNKVSNPTGQAQILPEEILLMDGELDGDKMVEFDRPAKDEDEALQYIATVFWSLEIRPVLPLEKAGTSEGACLGHQRQGHTLRGCVGAELVRGILNDRAKIGQPKHNYSIGSRGEQIAGQLYQHYHAHGVWNDANDMGNEKLYEVKTMAGDTTPIMPRARERKLDMMASTGKDMKVILLKVEDKGIRVYEHELMPSFYDKTQPDAVYIVSTQDSTEVGFIDPNGNFREGP